MLTPCQNNSKLLVRGKTNVQIVSSYSRYLSRHWYHASRGFLKERRGPRRVRGNLESPNNVDPHPSPRDEDELKTNVQVFWLKEKQPV